MQEKENFESQDINPEDIDESSPHPDDKNSDREYLEKHLESGSLLHILSSHFGVSKRMSGREKREEVADYPYEGEVAFEKKSVKIDLSYRAMHGGAEYIREIGVDGFLHLAFLDQCRADQDTTKILENFQITTTDHSGKSLSLEDILPPGSVIFFQPSKKVEAKTNFRAKACIIKGDLRTPYAVLALLHEAAHLARIEQMDDEDRNKYLEAQDKRAKREALDEKEARLVLEEERNVWALVLNKARPFISDSEDSFLQKRDVRDLIHNYTLNTYSANIRHRTLKEGLLSRIKGLLSNPRKGQEKGKE